MFYVSSICGVKTRIFTGHSRQPIDGWTTPISVFIGPVGITSPKKKE